MTHQAIEPTVKRAVTVAVPQAHAFRVFAERFDSWWPRGHHIAAVEMKEAIIEPRAGGRFYEKGVDGSECSWGRVLAWEPPHRLVLAWHLNAQWQYDPDPNSASEVEVTFVAESSTLTRVELEHRGFERHGEGGETIRQGVGAEQGWGWLLQRYAEAAVAPASHR
jgi:uncharacterized protein YndB with AHSA1/START domain